MKTFYSYSFGCRVNEAEKEEIDRQLIKSGLKFEPKTPDIYIINTCCVTQKAEREARQLIYQVKKKLPDIKIVITGCAATYWKKNSVYNKLPVDLLNTNKDKQNLVRSILDIASQGHTSHRSGVISGDITSKFLNSGRLMIKIQDGCQRFCTYCIVPYLRGTPKSETIKNLVRQLANKNLGKEIKEVIFTAINTEAFGYDTGEKLTTLINQTIEKTKIPRISFGSIHPWSINDEFFNLYKKIKPLNKLVNFFHIPLQSGSNKILNLMKRGYSREEMLQKLQSLKNLNEYALIATDIIVGYFEETNSDFQDTYDFLKNSPIVKFHVFRYSKRNNTAGFYMAKRLKEPSPKEKSYRAKKLIDLGKRKYEEFLQKNVGRKSSVLILKQTIDGYHQGLLDNQLPILIDIPPHFPPKRWKGGLCDTKITEFKNGKLFGKLI